MSFSFYTKAPHAPSLANLAALADDRRFCCEDGPDGEPETKRLPDGYACHAYLHGASARGVEIVYERGELQTRILSCSSDADHALAIALATGLAAKHGTLITPEDRELGYGPDALRAEFGDAWIAQQLAFGASVVATMVDRDGSTLEMSGCRRTFHVGPRFLASLRARRGALRDRVLDAFVRLQYIDDDDAYYAANVMTVTPKRGAAYTITAWAPGVSYLFPGTERLAVLADDAAIEIPYAAGATLLGKRWTWLDERHGLVDAVDGAAWTAFVARAREHQLA